MAARDTALSVLIACRTQEAWSDGALRERLSADRLEPREAALASRLVYSVLQNRLLLDYYLTGLLRGNPKKLRPVVLDILRLGACQILFFDKIPDSAAVNEAVRQAKKKADPKSAGLVNGVLRNLVRGRDSLVPPKDLSTAYSCPKPMTELLRHCVGDERLEALLKCQNEAPPVTVRVNTGKTDAASLAAKLEQEGVKTSVHPVFPDYLTLEESGSIAALESFRQGLFFVQDPASGLAVRSAGLKPGMRVLDCCSAPGGKSFAAALEMEGKGEIFSGDLHAHKIPLIEAGARRLGISIIRAEQRDASRPKPEWNDRFDCVLCDVPCSGLGVIRKKPDIRYKSTEELAGLPAVQKKLLEVQSAFVRPGGLLLYSTCTIVPEENGGVVGQFLSEHPEFRREPMSLPFETDPDGGMTLLPCVHGTDGFYFCLMRKAQ